MEKTNLISLHLSEEETFAFWCIFHGGFIKNKNSVHKKNAALLYKAMSGKNRKRADDLLEEIKKDPEAFTENALREWQDFINRMTNVA